MLQSVILSRLPLISGTADLVLIVLLAWSLQEKAEDYWLWTLIGGGLVSFVSAMPFLAPLIGYLTIVFLARLLQRRVWQVPILAMFVATLVGTMIQHTINIVLLFINGTPLLFQETFTQVTLPSALLNLLLSLPVYILVSDLAKWLFPAEVEI
jgi:cell shape-determining protein MreD